MLYLTLYRGLWEKILSQDSRVVARGFNFGKIIWSKAASNAGQKMSYLGLGWKRNFLTEWERLVPAIYAGSLTHRRTPHTVEPTSDSVSDPAYMPGTPYSRVRDLMTNIGEWELSDSWKNPYSNSVIGETDKTISVLVFYIP